MRQASTSSTSTSLRVLEREGHAERDRPVTTASTVAPAMAPGRTFALGVTAQRVVIAVAVATVVAAAIGLRLWHLNALGFNSDEAAYAGQAAAIAGDPHLSALFPVFRAHPLLFQLLVSLIYRVHVDELGPRLLAVAFGIATVVAGYGLGARIYGRTAGVLTALFLAVMPYLVIVNRQALLDGPMVFFSVVALWLLAKFAAEERPASLYAAAAVLGLAFLTKETAILLVPAAYAFLAADAERAGQAQGAGAVAGVLRARRTSLSAVAHHRRRVEHGAALPGLAALPSGQPRVELLSHGRPLGHGHPSGRARRRGARGGRARADVELAGVAPGVLDRRAGLLLRALAGERLPVPAPGRRAGGGPRGRPAFRGGCEGTQGPHRFAVLAGREGSASPPP